MRSPLVSDLPERLLLYPFYRYFSATALSVSTNTNALAYSGQLNVVCIQKHIYKQFETTISSVTINRLDRFGLMG